MTEQVLMAEALFDRIAAAGISLHSPPFAVNIGCGDGKQYFDPAYPLFRNGFSGLAIDGQEQPDLAENLKGLPVMLQTSTWIFPDNIAAILWRGGCPPDPDFFKMDIDGFDAPVMREVFRAGFRPLVVQMEINPEIPPPFAFTVCSHHRYVPGGQTGFFGCSLAYAVDLMNRYGYALIQLDFTTGWTHDALFVNRALLSWELGLVELEPRQAFLNERPLLPHIQSIELARKMAWRERTDVALVRDEIWLALSLANEQKHGHREVPFELYISD